MANKLLSMYQQACRWPFGQRIFSAYAARKAPYFATISPLIALLEPNRCEVLVRKRCAVQNHIGTVHVIAIVNGLEMAMGFLSEASIPSHLRWIPKGMVLNYPNKAGTDIKCTATVAPDAWKPGDMPVSVEAYDTDGQVVVSGIIQLWISERPDKSTRTSQH